jgi:hypothetical protein
MVAGVPPEIAEPWIVRAQAFKISKPQTEKSDQ